MTDTPTTHPLSSRLRVPGESDPVVETAADELDRQAAEIARLLKERDAAFAMSRCECASDECCANLVRLHDEIARLRAEGEALRVDAERYWWLRDNPDHESVPFFGDGRWYVPYKVSNAGGMGGGVGAMPFDTLDAAIDAARNAEGRSDD